MTNMTRHETIVEYMAEITAADVEVQKCQDALRNAMTTKQKAEVDLMNFLVDENIIQSGAPVQMVVGLLYALLREVEGVRP